MSAVDELAITDGWIRPPASACEREDYTSPLPGGDRTRDYMAIRLLRDQTTFFIVEFSLILLTHDRGKLTEVAEVDSCHDVDVHLHQCGRNAGGRVGSPTPLCEIHSLEDVQSGYDIGLAHMTDQWITLRQRWHYN